MNEQDKKNENVATTALPALPQPIKKRRGCCYLAVGFGLIFASLLAFLATASGQKTLLSLADKWLDGLQIEQIDGSLQQGLRLQNTRYQMDGVAVKVGEAELKIGFQCLWQGKACVDKLALKETKVVVETAKLPPAKPKQTDQPFEFNLPLPISVEQLSLDQVAVQVDDLEIALDRFQSGISGKGKDLSLVPTFIDGLTVSLPPQAETTEKAKPQPNPTASLKAQIDWQAINQTLAKPLLSKLEPIKLPLNLHIPQFEAKNMALLQKVKNAKEGQINTTSLVQIPLLAIEGQSDESKVALKRLDIQTDKGNVAGQGWLNLSGNYPLEWQLKAESPKLTEWKIPASQAQLSLQGELLGTTALKLATQGAVEAKLSGEVKLSEPNTPLALSLTSPQAQYPFMPAKGESPLKLAKTRLDLKGNLLNYQLSAQSELSGMGIPASRFSLKGQGTSQQFEVADLVLNALNGEGKLSGKVDWTDGIGWQSSAHLNNVNTQSLLPEWAAVLSGSFESEGYAGRGKLRDQWQVRLAQMDIQGELAQKRLQLQGNLTSGSDRLLEVPNAVLNYGENHIELAGVLGEKSDFTAKINAPNLKGLIPNLSAQIQGDVKLVGKLSQPSLDLDLMAKNISYDQLKLAQLTAKGQIASLEQIQGNLALNLNGFQYDKIKIANAEAVATGSEANHRLTLQAKGEPIGANLQLSGKFDRSRQVWAGSLSQAEIQSPVGEWKNQQPISVSYSQPQIQAEVSAHCWRNPNLNLCFPQAFTAGKEGRVPFEIQRFDLAVVQPYLDKNSQLSGLVNAKGEASWFSQKAPQAKVELTSSGISFNQRIDYRQFPLTLKPVKVTASLQDNQLQLNTDVTIENNGRLNSDLSIKDLTHQRTLSGEINLDRISLKMLSPLMSKGETITGDINARLKVGGTTLSPLLNGQLNLTNLTAKAYAMPFDITGGNLNLLFNGAKSTLTGKVQTNVGSVLNLEGDANWQKLDAWQTRVNAQADKFRVDLPNIAKVAVSPNIEVKATPTLLQLGGNIDIPWARIAVEALPDSVVSVSDDEVILDKGKAKSTKVKLPQTLPAQAKNGMAIKADITINIGDDVRLEAYGLKTALKGKIAVRQGNAGLGLYGQVNLLNGSYASFGQDLIIRKGAITFAGLPSQPSLNIEAIRNPEAIEDPNVVAGVRVTGGADSPEVKIFSEPSMPQDQALSYVLTGRSLENSGDSTSSNSMSAALIGLGLSKSSKLVGSMGQSFGISDLSVTTAGIGDNTKVVVSGNFTPKFKIKYGVGIFAPLTELTLRYRLAPSLYLQWVSSINQAVDLLYRFEFD